MKYSFKLLGLATLLLINESSFAVNPPNKWYAGMMLGVSYTPATNFSYVGSLTSLPTNVTLTHSVLGNFALNGGYRMSIFRAEGEFLFNTNPYSTLKFGGVTIQSTSGKLSPTSPTGMIQPLQMKGQTYTGALMLNGIFDFFEPGGQASWVPYLGGGIGYAYISNSIQFYNQSIEIPNSNFSINDHAPAAQIIMGLNYFFDDFFAIGLDFRYFSTTNVAPFNERMQLGSMNLTFSGSFCT